MSNWFPRPRTRPASILVPARHEDSAQESSTGNQAAGGRRRGRWPQPAGILAVTAGLVLLTAACGSSPSSSAAGGQPAGGSGSQSSSGTGGGSGTSKLVSDQVAYARCIRAHGVADFPDPDASGQEPASTKNLASNPQFTAASNACRHLIHGLASQFQADLRSYVKFAQCMRAHGVPNFPDPSTDPDGSPVFTLTHASINLQSTQVRSAALGCQSQLHLAKLPNYRV
jgi:hypothetical protein